MVGGFHVFYLLAMNQAFGVDKDTAAAAGTAAHALSNLPVLVLGLLLLGREGLTFGRVAKMTDEKPGDGDPGKRDGDDRDDEDDGARRLSSGLPDSERGRGAPRLNP
jgi:hypothetical protein